MPRRTAKTLIGIGFLIPFACNVMLPTELVPPTPKATDSPPKATPLSELPPTWTEAPTLTPTITFTPSATSPPPTATPNYSDFDIGAMMTPAGATTSPDLPDPSNWNVNESQTASLRLPSSYEVIDLGEEFGILMAAFFEGFLDAFTEFADDMSAEFDVTPETTEEIPDLEELPAIDLLIAADEEAFTSILLTSEETTPGLSTEDLLNQALTGLEADFTLISRENLEDAERPTERVILEVNDPERGLGKDMLYGVMGENHAWTLILSSPLDSYEANRPVFEAIAASLSPLE